MTTTDALLTDDSEQVPKEELPQSPRAMVDAVMAEAAAERARLTQPTSEDCENEKMLPTALLEHSDASLRELLDATQDEEKHLVAHKVVHDQIEVLMQQGLKAFHDHESTMRDLSLAKAELESKDRELKRLRSSEESSRKTITNLLRAIETSKRDARDVARHVEIEAKLRSDFCNLRGEHNCALGTVSSLKRKVVAVEEDLESHKAKLARVEQAKIKMERDNRAAISLAKSVGSETSSDIDFYKRKSSELQNQLSAQQALVAEQKAMIDEMRRQQERSMSQNRLASMRNQQDRSMTQIRLASMRADAAKRNSY